MESLEFLSFGIELSSVVLFIPCTEQAFYSFHLPDIILGHVLIRAYQRSYHKEQELEALERLYRSTGPIFCNNEEEILTSI